MRKRSKINDIADFEEGIAMANSVLIKVSKDEEERARILRQEKTEMDWASYIAEAKEEGREEERDFILSLLNKGLTTEEIKIHLQGQK